jgi:SAM-dependent methyltransferase
VSLRESLPSGDRSFSEVFSRALRGSPCSVIGLSDGPAELPVHSWRRQADGDDLALLSYCEGPTLDIGCGPGRLTAALASMGHEALGIDVVGEAVGQTRDRGVSAICLDVFDELPHEGRWQTVLLADENLGIGGDPEALLVRTRELLEPRGRVVAEVAPPGVRRSTEWAVLESEGHRSRPFRWSVVGADDIHDVAAAAGFTRVAVHRIGERWCAVLGSHWSTPVLLSAS